MGEGGFVTCGHGQNPPPEEVKCKQKEAEYDQPRDQCMSAT